MKPCILGTQNQSDAGSELKVVAFGQPLPAAATDICIAARAGDPEAAIAAVGGPAAAGARQWASAAIAAGVAAGVALCVARELRK